MSRVDATQSEILTAVKTRLQSFLGLGARHCFLVARARDITTIPPGGDYWITIAPSPGSFHEAEQDYAQCTEDAEVTVAAYTRIKLDSTGHDYQLLLHASRGLIPIKRKLLQALVGHDLQINEAGDTCLRWVCHARRSGGPDIVRAGDDGVYCGRIQVDFGVPFDWELEAA
jgi:hypothetical protein